MDIKEIGGRVCGGKHRHEGGLSHHIRKPPGGQRCDESHRAVAALVTKILQRDWSLCTNKISG